MGIDNPKAVGPYQTDARVPADGGNLIFDHAAFLSNFAKSCRNDDDSFDSLLSAIVHGSKCCLWWKDDDGQIDRLRQLRNRAVALDTVNGFGLWIYRIKCPLIVASKNIDEYIVPHLSGSVRSSYHCYRFGRKD